MVQYCYTVSRNYLLEDVWKRQIIHKLELEFRPPVSCVTANIKRLQHAFTGSFLHSPDTQFLSLHFLSLTLWCKSCLCHFHFFPSVPRDRKALALAELGTGSQPWCCPRGLSPVFFVRSWVWMQCPFSATNSRLHFQSNLVFFTPHPLCHLSVDFGTQSVRICW